jgi:2-polyprenyl-3-methyl-5-hydroxy-6-metoxy-1,4-benzoquinol methylase
MSHEHEIDPAALMTQEFWDERYGSTEQVWSGNPNQRLVEQVSSLKAGTALEVGCGEGADAIWLATRGWRVLAIDVSPVALERAARQVANLGEEVADRVAWQQVDLLTWDPAPRQFDLVTAHFIHTPSDVRASLHRRLAAAVRPGGSLLIVGHHPRDLEGSNHRWRMPDFMFTAEEIAATLSSDDWEIVVAETQSREAKLPDGNQATIHDAVLHARRRR